MLFGKSDGLGGQSIKARGMPMTDRWLIEEQRDRRTNRLDQICPEKNGYYSHTHASSSETNPVIPSGTVLEKRIDTKFKLHRLRDEGVGGEKE